MLSLGQETASTSMISQLLVSCTDLHKTELVKSQSWICLVPSEPVSDLEVSMLTDSMSTNISLCPQLVDISFFFS